MSERQNGQKAFMLRCQLPSGTFRLAPHSDVINPYFTNIALAALVELGEADAVMGHLVWYLNHVTPRGYVNDFRLRGEEECDTGKADSEDSYHATFFSLLRAWIERTDNPNWPAGVHDKLADMLRALLRLQQPDGLTWAKESWRVKYVMDNCEVAQGLADAGWIFAGLGDGERAKLALEKAEQCRQGILSTYSVKKQCFAVYDRVLPNWGKWYPDATSQAFPVLYGIIPAAGPIASHLYGCLTEHFPYYDRFKTGDFFPWMVMGEWADIMGDRERSARMLEQAEHQYIYGPRQRYWLLHEAGRFLRLARRIEEM
jgi:hypothetical protein